MKLSFVTPRCGEEIVGGAEHAIVMLADNCRKYAHCEVEILTTTATDERTWTPTYEVGRDTVRDIDVVRFYNEKIDRVHFDEWASQLLLAPEKTSDRQFDEWLIRQGPYSPDLLDAIEQCDSDAIIFHPMLSSPTSHGVFRAQKPVIIHPALHEEPLSYMPGYKKVIGRADLLSFSTRAEQQLSHRIHSSQLAHQAVIGFGVDTPDVVENSAAHLREFELASKSYAVVMGRVDQAKGSNLCAEMFLAARMHLRSIDTLVFIGPVSESFSIENDHIVCTGVISNEQKWALLSNARCLISPSATESFSLVLLEAMKMSIPVLVNDACAPTREHVENAQSGYSFGNYSDFIAGIELCASDSQARNAMIENGKNYVEKYFEWEPLIARYAAVVEDCISRSTSS